MSFEKKKASAVQALSRRDVNSLPLPRGGIGGEGGLKMEIIHTRTKTLDGYSIDNVKLTNEISGNDGSVYPYFLVSLKPSLYHRTRFEGASFEKKKKPGCTENLFFMNLKQS